MKKKVGIVSLGCPKNLVDSELILGRLEGYEVTPYEDQAEIIIVNTCGFIESAKQESINAILEMSEHKKNNCKKLVVTGCLAQRYKDEITHRMPEVDAVIGHGSYENILGIIGDIHSGNKPVVCPDLFHARFLDGKRVLSTVNQGYAYLKIAEGCDNNCTYCAIPLIKGRLTGRSIEAIICEAERLSEQGVKELILVAQDITKYGVDIYGKSKLVDLIGKLSKIAGIEWIRLLYCYPDDINEDLIDEITKNSKICKYIDIPIQHISDRVLKMMGRRGDSKKVRFVLERLKEKVPEIVIRTSLIVGFPGEEEQDFDELCEFVSEYKFDRLGIFTYSREEGTAASRFKSQISERVKKKRQDVLMKMQKKIANEKNIRRLGKVYKTLVEGVSEDGIFYCGRTYGEAPDIDGMVYFTSEAPLDSGGFVNVKVLNVDDYDLVGEVVNESSK